ncbi:NAD-dependent deacetylase [Pseudarcicella hirudinis]|uniref:NAD-dependent protein deacylase n=1 Tax=Pseudarcicella hirudinis TaxID=1079859 RepID=A0A1I5UU23_9BACT|nr:NAD-dependent deacylase [Pseudarcicella hirudinis]SFP98712.1 NAD-dependent deacetylase [Pseudarcicella hirudinis]
MKKKIVVLTGAGISAESGIATFRDSNGLWENHAIEEVATPEGFRKNPALVLEFYNQRRKQAMSAQPNDGHLALKALEAFYEVQIITQNVDNLHEKAGSVNVLHLHGELFQSRSTLNSRKIYEIDGWELKLGDLAEDGSQLRPNIVWFGEDVPNIIPAAQHCAEADIFIIVGTSMQVYPAAGLIDYVPKSVPVYVIDPHIPSMQSRKNLTFIQETGSTGLKQLHEILRNLSIKLSDAKTSRNFE